MRLTSIMSRGKFGVVDDSLKKFEFSCCGKKYGLNFLFVEIKKDLAKRAIFV